MLSVCSALSEVFLKISVTCLYPMSQLKINFFLAVSAMLLSQFVHFNFNSVFDVEKEVGPIIESLTKWKSLQISLLAIASQYVQMIT